MTYRVFSVDALSGALVDELRMLHDSFTCSWLCNGSGQFTGTIPLGLYDVTLPTREIAVFRDDSYVWGGPITRLRRSVAANAVEIGAREVSWRVMHKATINSTTSYNATPTSIAQQIAQAAISDSATVAATPGYGGPIPNMSAAVVGTPAAAAITRDYTADEHKKAGAEIEELAGQDPGGFLHRVTYSGSISAGLTRVWQFGEDDDLFPATPFTFVPGEGFIDFIQEQDIEDAVNRLWILSEGGAVVGLQNDSSFTQGDILLEDVFFVSPSAQVDATYRGQQLRRQKAPPVNIVEAIFRPSDALPFDASQAGGKTQFHITATGGLAFEGPWDWRPIAGKTLQVSGGADVVTLTHFEQP